MRWLALLLAALTVVAGAVVEPLPTFDPSVSVVSSVTLGSGGTLDWWGRASMHRLPSGVIVLVYRRGTVHFVNDGALYIKFSDDDGATWTAENTKLGGGAVAGFPMNPSTLSAGQDAGEPILYQAPNGDLILQMWRIDYGVSMGGTWQSESSDGGESWTPSHLVDFGIAGVSNTIIFATDDSFVWNRSIYAGARIYSGGADGTPSEMILIRSDDNGQTWQKVSTIMAANEGSGSHGGQEVGLEYIGNGRIIAMLRDNDHTKSYQRVSEDLGATWGSLVDVTATVGIAGRQRVYTRSHLLGLPGWWNDPVLYMTGFVHQTPGSSTDRRNAIWVSPDRGATWAGPFYLNATTEDGGYGDLQWDFTNDRPFVVTYAGTNNAASLIQYNLDIDLAA